MVRVAISAGFVLVALLGSPAQAVAPQVPAAAFAALPEVSDVEMSPDGRLLAWRDQSGPDSKVQIYDIDAKSYRRTLAIDPAMTLRSLLWADDTTLLMNVSKVQVLPAEERKRRYTFFRTMSVDVVTGNSCMLLKSGSGMEWVTGDELVAWHTTEPHSVIMATMVYSPTAEREDMGTHIANSRADSGWIGELFRVDTRTGQGAVIGEGDQYTEQWIVNADGAPIARSEWRPARKHYVIEARRGAQWDQILERDDDQLVLQGLSPDGKSVIATGPGKDGWLGLWTIALDGSGARQMHQKAAANTENADVEDVIRDRFSGLPVSAVLGGLEPTTGSGSV